MSEDDEPQAERNLIKIKDRRVFGGKITLLHTYSLQESIRNVMNEVWISRYYQPGLRHIRKVEKPVVVDIGSFIGISALYFSQHKGATIHAIEPNPRSYECLCLNTEGHNVIPHHLAMYNGHGEGVVEFPAGSSVGNSLFVASAKEDTNTRVTVPNMDIRTFMERNGIEHIDLLKVDCEGAEYMLFMSEAFRQVAPQIDMIIGEAHYFPFPPALVCWLLESHGYSFRWLKHRNYSFHWIGSLGEEAFDMVVWIPTCFVAERKNGRY